MADQSYNFYYRNGCHLCDDLASLLYRGWPAVFEQLRWRDVDQNPAWRQAYGDKVPVLERNALIISELRPNPEKLREHFGNPAIQL